jgi:hypothetical protein
LGYFCIGDPTAMMENAAILVFTNSSSVETRRDAMGTDSVRLFDRRLCDDILALDNLTLEPFVSSHLEELDQFNELRYGFADIDAVPNRIRQLNESGLSEQELKCILVESLCPLGERLYVDYWGSYAEVFVGDPPGSIPDFEIFPHLREQRFLLLRPEHLDQMLGSLFTHRADLRVMLEKAISLLTQWRDHCMNDKNTMVAYYLAT